MSYKVLSTNLKNVTSEAFAAAASDGRSFSVLAEALAWASRPRGANFAVVVVEEGRGRSVAASSAEDAARSVL